MDILELIPFGQKNAISRQKLAEECGISDRQMRRCIEELRKEKPIANFQDGQGYFRPETEWELKVYIAQENARAMSILKNLTAAKRELQKVNGQLTLDEF